MKGIRLGRPPGSSRKRESFKEQHAEIQFSIENGEPMSVIARRLGVHRNTLRKYINEMSISEEIKI
jgi:transposase-like protein